MIMRILACIGGITVFMGIVVIICEGSAIVTDVQKLREDIYQLRRQIDFLMERKDK